MDRPSSRRLHWALDYRGGAALVGLCLALHLPGVFSLPPIDRDEARFAEAARRMAVAESWHDRIVPMIQDRPRLKKPPLTYWLQAPAAALTGAAESPDPWGGGIWAYRLPSVAGALAATLLTWRLGCRMFAPPVGWLAGALLAASAVLLFDLRQARADQLLLACTTLAQLALCHIWCSRAGARARPIWPIVLWVAIALGILAKGPITPALVALTALLLSWIGRDWVWLRRLRPGLGAAVLVAVAAPWFMVVSVVLGFGKLWYAFLGEVMLRSVRPMESHWGPPGTYTALLPVLFWPGSLALVPAVWRAVRLGVIAPRDGSCTRCVGSVRLRPGRAGELFCLAWLLPGLLVFELLVTKLAHYPLPLFPALALLSARGLCSGRWWRWVLEQGWGRAALVGWAALSETVVVVVPVTLAWLTRAGVGSGAWLGFGLACAAAQLALVSCFVALARRRFVNATVFALGAAVATSVGLFGTWLPAQTRLWISPQVNAVLRRIDPEGRRPLAAVGYQEDSLVFLTRGRVQRLRPEELAAWWTAHPEGLLVSAPPPDGPEYRVHAEITGFNYARGRTERVAVAERVVRSIQP